MATQIGNRCAVATLSAVAPIIVMDDQTALRSAILRHCAALMALRLEP
jgi:hypothetical protein